MIRLGSALFNANHAQLGSELERVEKAGIDFLHFDVFDGHFVPDLGFAPRTLETLRPLTRLPFEVHLAANDPLRFLPALKKAGADLVFLPAESTLLFYEAIFAVREHGMRPGLCLALGTSLTLLEPVLPLLESVLLLGRVTGEGTRGRELNELLYRRLETVRGMIDRAGLNVDLQAAGGLELEHVPTVVAAGATSLPFGAALHRQPDLAAFVRQVRGGGAAALPERLSGAPFKVLIASRSFGYAVPDTLERMQQMGCELIANDLGRAPNESELLERIVDVDALVSGTEPVTARVLAAANKLKVIAKHGVGYENINLEAARAKNIPVCLAAGAITDSVADHAMALLLALVRQIPQDNQQVKNGQWKRVVGTELRGKTLGIVGLGQIGKALGERAAAFGMRLVAFDTFQDASYARRMGLTYLELEALLETADVVSLHAPVTAQTRFLINDSSLARMKRGSFLINTARGELVDEAALFTALQTGHLGGAATDVFGEEPPKDSPLCTLENFIATAHNAAQTNAGLQRMGEITAENLLRVLAGLEPLHRLGGQ